MMILSNMMVTLPHPHDGRKGHHYYTTSTARISCIVVMALAALIPTNRAKPSWPGLVRPRRSQDESAFSGQCSLTRGMNVPFCRVFNPAENARTNVLRSVSSLSLRWRDRQRLAEEPRRFRPAREQGHRGRAQSSFVGFDFVGQGLLEAGRSARAVAVCEVAA